jgi:prolyl 4-hydroxylase
MAKTIRLIRLGLSVSLVLAVLIPGVIFTFDNHDTDDVRGNRFELTRVVRHHEMSRDQQKETGRIQPQFADREKPTRLVLGADLGEPQIIGDMEAKVVQRVEKARKYFNETVMVEPRYEKVRTLCRNRNPLCAFWAEQGECHKNHRYMKANCAPVCFSCEELQSTGFKKPTRVDVGTDLGEPQTLGKMAAKVVQRVEKARKYFHETVMVEPRYEKVRTLCRNHNASCGFWATEGYCHKNSGYMRKYCAPVCFSCEDLHVEARCPLDPNATNAWYPGDLNRIFQRLITDPALERHAPKVLSRPSLVGGDTEATADYQLGPWVLVLEDFLSAQETERMIQAGAEVGYARSTDVGKLDKDGTFEDKVSDRRTSTNAWCNVKLCEEDPVVKTVVSRIETLTQIPFNNSEALQLLRYEEGQFYKIHNDYIAYEKERNEGVRVLTVFLYLSDVEEGGGTNFPKLDLTVEPKRGRALIWPSVLDEDPHEIDSRTNHQALPVIKGLKYGANAWLHQRDIKTPTALGCLDYRPPAKLK